MSSPPFVEVANRPRLHRAYDQLVGEDRWHAPTALGTFPIRFPSRQDIDDDGWHVDVSFGTSNPDFMEWRANVKSSGRALLMLFLFSDVGHDDARPGSAGAPTPPSHVSSCHMARRAQHSGSFPPMAMLPRRTATSTRQPARPARSIYATPFWCMRHSRIKARSHASWRSRLSCREANSTPPCRLRRSRSPFVKPAG